MHNLEGRAYAIAHRGLCRPAGEIHVNVAKEGDSTPVLTLEVDNPFDGVFEGMPGVDAHIPDHECFTVRFGGD